MHAVKVPLIIAYRISLEAYRVKEIVVHEPC